MDKIKKMNRVEYTPLVTIITVVCNAADTIEVTLLSIVNQEYKNIEYIIIDGGSTDGTIDIIKKYDDKISFWISEPDNGIYDAMNKGVAHSNGKWILNINAGDLLLKVPVEYLQSVESQNYAGICGSVLLDNKNILLASYNWVLKIKNTLPHQALFYNKELLYAGYNLDYKVYADYSYNLGMLRRRKKVKIISDVVAMHSTDGISQNRDTAEEFFRIIKNEEGYFYLVLSYLYFRVKGLIYRIKKNISCLN